MTTTLEAPASAPVLGGPRPRRVIWQLARVEGQRMVRHPLIWVGIGLATLLAVTVFKDLAIVTHRDMVTLTGCSLAIAGVTWWVANLATLRSQRHDTDPLYDATPTLRDARTQSHLLAVLWPAGLALAWTFTMIAIGVARGAIWAPEPFDVLAVPAVVGLFGVFGVACGRLVPSVAAGFFASLTVGVQLAWLATLTNTVTRLRPWSDWGPMYGVIELYPRRPALHLVWVLALVAIAAIIALLRTRVTPGRLVGGAIAGAFAVASAVPMVTVWDDEAVMALGEALNDPFKDAVCVLENGIRTCSLPAYREWHDSWRAAVLGLLETVPAQARPDDPVQVVLGYGDIWTLQESVPPAATRDLLSMHFVAGPLTIEIGPREPPLGSRDIPSLSFGLAAVRELLDFGEEVPLDASDPAVRKRFDIEAGTYEGRFDILSPCSGAGQAREAVAAFVVARAHPDWERELRATLANQPVWSDENGDEVEVDDLFVQNRGAQGAPMHWTRSGTALAVRMLEREAGATMAIVHKDWSRWMNPATTTAELAEAVGVEIVPEHNASGPNLSACP